VECDPLNAQSRRSSAKELVLDFIRARLKDRGKDAAFEVEQRELPTGERILVVRADKA
jgi:hypothetical protein